MGSGLGAAFRCSTEGKDLYGATVYLDSQKVCADDGTPYLMRLSTYSPVERSMLEICCALVPSESKESCLEFLHHLKVTCAKGYGGEESFASIEGFNMNVWEISADAAAGFRLAWEEAFPEKNGRNRFVECEFHFRRSEKGFEEKLRDEGLVKEHRKLVKQFLVSNEGPELEQAKTKMKVSSCLEKYTVAVRGVYLVARVRYFQCI